MDIGDMVELQNASKQKRYLLAVIDISSKYGVAIVLNDKSVINFNCIEIGGGITQFFCIF